MLVDLIRRRVTVSGQVQGVFFRTSCQAEALAVGVTGWVRNCSDGRVEAVLEGDPAAVERMVVWMRTGPPHARVGEVQATVEEPAGERGFTVR